MCMCTQACACARACAMHAQRMHRHKIVYTHHRSSCSWPKIRPSSRLSAAASYARTEWRRKRAAAGSIGEYCTESVRDVCVERCSDDEKQHKREENEEKRRKYVYHRVSQLDSEFWTARVCCVDFSHALGAI